MSDKQNDNKEILPADRPGNDTQWPGDKVIIPPKEIPDKKRDEETTVPFVH